MKIVFILVTCMTILAAPSLADDVQMLKNIGKACVRYLTGQGFYQVTGLDKSDLSDGVAKILKRAEESHPQVVTTEVQAYILEQLAEFSRTGDIKIARNLMYAIVKNKELRQIDDLILVVSKISSELMYAKPFDAPTNLEGALLEVFKDVLVVQRNTDLRHALEAQGYSAKDIAHVIEEADKTAGSRLVISTAQNSYYSLTADSIDSYVPYPSKKVVAMIDRQNYKTNVAISIAKQLARVSGRLGRGLINKLLGNMTAVKREYMREDELEDLVKDMLLAKEEDDAVKALDETQIVNYEARLLANLPEVFDTKNTRNTLYKNIFGQTIPALEVYLKDGRGHVTIPLRDFDRNFLYGSKLDREIPFEESVGIERATTSAVLKFHAETAIDPGLREEAEIVYNLHIQALKVGYEISPQNTDLGYFGFWSHKDKKSYSTGTQLFSLNREWMSQLSDFPPALREILLSEIPESLLVYSLIRRIINEVQEFNRITKSRVQFGRPFVSFHIDWALLPGPIRDKALRFLDERAPEIANTWREIDSYHQL